MRTRLGETNPSPGHHYNGGVWRTINIREKEIFRRGKKTSLTSFSQFHQYFTSILLNYIPSFQAQTVSKDELSVTLSYGKSACNVLVKKTHFQ